MQLLERITVEPGKCDGSVKILPSHSYGATAAFAPALPQVPVEQVLQS